MPAASQIITLCIAVTTPFAQAFGESQKYLIASSPSTRRVGFLKLPMDGSPALGNEPMRDLVTSGLSVPQGVAVDQWRMKLYVADPDLNKLVGYDLQENDGVLKVGSQFTVAPDVETRWVTVDGVGNIFFTDEANNTLYKVSSQAVDSDALPATPTVVYDGSTTSKVSSPGGILTDNYFLYWVNKASGTQVGSVIRATQTPNVSTATPTTALAMNTMKSYGVCLAPKVLFYTDEQTNLYTIPRVGGTVQTVSNALAEPRGCSFDGEGTVYVADKSYNAVYQFAANADTFTPNTPLQKVADFQGVFGLAMYTQVPSSWTASGKTWRDTMR